MISAIILTAAALAAAWWAYAYLGGYWTALRHLDCRTPLRERAKILATGRIEWLRQDGGTDPEQLGWRDRWTLAGPQPWNWWWIRRYGQQACGCTINPITRRRLLTYMGCDRHDSLWNAK